ncbi:DUF805 domain-containing protein [Listeria aquatica]|uniref:DUF805 domain-containing protein n=1 Tax=Listeria aquatica TaxID=1494960 RepID=UPI00056B5DAD|nr:DUF805 domain-containing protein [Listeria aquatica]
MGFVEAYKSFWRNYANFSGRASRSEYWYTVLWNGMISAIFYILALIFGLSTFLAFAASMGETEVSGVAAMGPLLTIGIIFWLYGIAILIPSLSLLIRRIRDTGKSPWLIFLTFIPFVGSIIILVLTLLPSEYADFDADPYGY